ncbi:MAG: 23S rRNA (adenine(2030)-N(6))-methyltransferase RlmJ [Parvularculaceae bacterium]
MRCFKACRPVDCACARPEAKPFAVLDTHAGRGSYDLSGEEARRSGEHHGGVLRIYNESDAPRALQPYLLAVGACNPFGGALRWYPGSPLIIQSALRADDSAKFCELHPDERRRLQDAIGRDGRIKIFERDGYEAVRAFLPPKERRGLVLIDPPFEKPGEYERLAQALTDGMKRWASGAFMIWGPIKDDAGFGAFAQAAATIGRRHMLEAELSIGPRAAGELSGSRLVVINPPFGLAAGLAECLPYLSRKLAAARGGGWRVRETENGACAIDEGAAG